MKKYLILYTLLLISFFIQICFMRYAVWFPDLVLLIVVFTAIFHGVTSGVLMGLAAGFLKGVFSSYMFPLEIVLFPAVAIGAFMMARMLYRQSPIAQMLIATLAIFSVTALQVLYLNTISGNDLGLTAALANSWRAIIVTVMITPFVFYLLDNYT